MYGVLFVQGELIRKSKLKTERFSLFSPFLFSFFPFLFPFFFFSPPFHLLTVVAGHYIENTIEIERFYWLECYQSDCEGISMNHLNIIIVMTTEVLSISRLYRDL